MNGDNGGPKPHQPLIPAPGRTQSDVLAGYGPLGLAGPITPAMAPYFQARGVTNINTLDQLPDEVKNHILGQQAVVDALPPDFDWRRTLDVANQNRNGMSPETYDRIASAAVLGLSHQGQRAGDPLNTAVRMMLEAGVSTLPRAFAGQIEGGKLPPGIGLSPAEAGVAHIIGSLTATGAQGTLLVSSFGWLTAMPRLGSLVLQIPERVRDVVMGGVTLGALDAARPEGLNPNPDRFDLSARIASPLSNALGGGEAAQRIALFAGGAAFGGLLSGTFTAVARGVHLGREAYLATKLSEEDTRALAAALQRAGIAVAEKPSKREIIRQFLGNFDRVKQGQDVATVVADRLAREQYISSLITSKFGGEVTIPAVSTTERGEPILATLPDGYKVTPRIYKAAQAALTTETRPDIIEHAHRIVDAVHSEVLANAPTGVPQADAKRYVAALFRANPGGMSIATSVGEVNARELNELLGVRAVTVRAGDNVLIARPILQLSERGVPRPLAKKIGDFADLVRESNQGRTSANFTILHDGSVVRGDYVPGEMASTFRVPIPVINGEPNAEVGLREGLRLVQARVGDDHSVLVNLPRDFTRAQVGMLGQIADRGVTRMVIRPAAASAEPITIEHPSQMQVEDAFAAITGKKPMITAEMTKRIIQFQREGVFDGQAGVLRDGYPVQIIKRFKTKSGFQIQYMDPMTRARFVVPEETVSVLPTSLEGELKPSNIFISSLPPEEQQLFARLRTSINNGLAKPVRTAHDLDEFAKSRGRLVTPLGGGRYNVWDPISGETMQYENVKAAVNAIRAQTGPLPDLTPPEITEAFGEAGVNIGVIGGSRAPANFGEPVPIPDDMFNAAVEAGQQSWVAKAQLITPSRGYFMDLENKYKLPFGRVFLNLQNALVQRQNFLAAWIDGAAPGLPQGVMPLRQIMRLAGRHADGIKIGEWLESESDAVTRTALEASMTPREIQAAQEMRKLFNAAYDHFGVDREWLSNYLPHFRQFGARGGNDLRATWANTRGTPLPKAVDFIADYARTGGLSVYEKDAFKAARQYLTAGSHSRFMKEPFLDSARLVKSLGNNAIKAPLVHYMEAIRGTEFAETDAALGKLYEDVLAKLGTDPATAKTIGNKLTYSMLGLAYSAAMPWRMGMVLRNMFQTMQTAWPLMGGLDNTFAEAIGRSLTLAGRDAAIADGAIAVRTGAYFASQEIAENTPSVIRAMSDYGMRLYNGSDTWTRVVAYWSGRLRAEQAIGKYAERIKAGENLASAQRKLLEESRAFIHDKPVIDSFLRKLGTDPQGAAGWLGKNVSDETMYLYGRGNQPRWMRHIAGRFLGQFGTWPMWYIDFVRRTTRNLLANGYKVEAAKFIGRLALTNLATYAAGRDLFGVDLSRWAGGNSIFYNGGPSFEIIQGIADLERGAETYIADSQSPYAKQRMSSGLRTLQLAGRAFVPNAGAVRDLSRIWDAFRTGSMPELVAALTEGRVTQSMTVQQQLDMLTNPGRMSTDIELEHYGDNGPTAVELMERGMAIQPGQMAVPATGPAPSPVPVQPGQVPAPVRTPTLTPPATPGRPAGRPPMQPTTLPPSIRTGESTPIPY